MPREIGPDTLGRLVDEEVILPRGQRALTITRPTDLDFLLDQVAGDPEQNLPYWSEIWPSGIALADAILQQPELLRGQRTLELGCGLGITAIAALTADVDLTVTDYAAEALALCRVNALRNADREPATLQMNWRSPGVAVLDAIGAGFPVVLAADVLYEERDIEPLRQLLETLVAPDGFLWLAEPGRPVARRFLDAVTASGWQVKSETHHGPWPDPKDDGVIVGLHQLRRSK
jgi:predicted nicotinamide N-methyase